MKPCSLPEVFPGPYDVFPDELQCIPFLSVRTRSRTILEEKPVIAMFHILPLRNRTVGCCLSINNVDVVQCNCTQIKGNIGNISAIMCAFEKENQGYVTD